MLNTFRKIAFWEGISLIVLVGLAVPLKYFLDLPELSLIIGWVHGVLFIAYILLATIVKGQQKCGMVLFFFCVLASLIPFGTFYLESKFLKKLSR